MFSIKSRKNLSIVIKVLLLIIFTGLIYIPLERYYNMFSKFPESTDPADWGTFGDFFGGVLNPVIAFASLIVLAYISIQVGRDTSKEKHKYFLVERRIEAFDILMRKFNTMNVLEGKVNTFVAIRESATSNVLEKIQSEKNARLDCHIAYKDFYNEVLLFGMHYEQIFDYNFQGEYYQKLMDDIISFNEYMDELIKGKIELDDEKEKKLVSNVDEFIEDLRKELVINQNFS